MRTYAIIRIVYAAHTKGRIIHAMSVVILYVDGARLLRWRSIPISGITVTR